MEEWVKGYRTDGPGVSSSHPLHFLSSHPHHDLVSGGDSSVSIKEMEIRSTILLLLQLQATSVMD